MYARGLPTCPLVDLTCGAGLLAFDEMCKKVERIALRDEDDLKTARAEAKVRRPFPLRAAPPTLAVLPGEHRKHPGRA